MTTKLLEVSKLSVKAADKQILQGIDLTIKSGETVAILGPNGAGKSTLARAIMGLDALRCSGKILFEAKDSTK
jgi:Fe-S cluster assembly ATPase SufC